MAVPAELRRREDGADADRVHRAAVDPHPHAIPLGAREQRPSDDQADALQVPRTPCRAQLGAVVTGRTARA